MFQLELESSLKFPESWCEEEILLMLVSVSCVFFIISMSLDLLITLLIERDLYCFTPVVLTFQLNRHETAVSFTSIHTSIHMCDCFTCLSLMLV